MGEPYAYSSVAFRSPDLALGSKLRWADLEDDRTTNASPRSTQSSCDEPCDAESQHTRQLWADMEDSDLEEADEVRLDEETVAAELPRDCGEYLNALKEPQSSWPSHTPRRARPASVHKKQAVDEDRSTTAFCTAPKGKGKAAFRTEELHSKGASKVASKGAAKGVGKGQRKDTTKGVGKGACRGKGAGKGANGEKFQCQFMVGIEEDSRFRVVRRIIGCGGEHMKRIAELSGAKLRLRGRGSNFLEGPERKESDDDLMLCVSAQDKDGFDKAKKAASELIENIHQSYRSHCRKSGNTCPELKMKVH